MWTPDLGTLYVTLILIDLVLTLILYLYGRTYRTYDGFAPWLFSLPVYCCSMFLIMFRVFLQSPLTLLLANVLFVFAFVMRYDAVIQFVRSEALGWKRYIVVLVAVLAGFSYLTYGMDSLVLRGAFLAVALLAIAIMAGIALAESQEPETRRVRFALAGIFSIIAFLYIVRVLSGIIDPAAPTGDLFTLVYYYALILTEIILTLLFVLLNMARHQAGLVKSEKQARESEEKYRSVLTLANDGIIIIQDGLVRYANPTAAAFYGAGADEITGRPFLLFIHPNEQQTIRGMYEKRVAGMQVQAVYETVVVHHDGTPIDVELNAGIITLDGKPADLVFIRDIRERKRSEKALGQAKKKLALLNDVTFNDIRNNVFTLSGYQTLVRDMISEPDTPIGQYLAKEEDLTQRITDALRFAQAYQDLGLKPAKWQEVRRTVLLALSHLDTRNLDHDIRTGDLAIFADPLLEQVFLILAENVVRHGEKATAITVRHQEEPDGSLTIFFEDNGAGIPADRKEQIFLPMFQKKRSAGLFLAREILEITEIGIRETGEPGNGARFEIRVPKGAHRPGVTGDGNR
ncbi:MULTISPECIES: PAS domain S-box protein [unclassified Methanoregula]|uniref:PAS domain S-box protein n=1 Tax=unclassified Methanoregula TaxID=2649730 RepID=UPI0009CCE550|nr:MULTISPECIES: PAS domain-containing sensor histidine kinase [unclassified Methanoregula]OPX63721.1 MAG: sensory histidine kinase AtoS [Methanoregula sp. PtaB.Bin085]OPY37262.1 MAG: sensory histidine kinase AtoS [Methanoregula sp. PtaU1.Bin006]